MCILVVCTYTHLHLWFANACVSLHEFQPDADIHVVWSTMKREFRRIPSSNKKNLWLWYRESLWYGRECLAICCNNCLPTLKAVSWVFLKISWKFISWASKIAVLDLFKGCYLLSFMFHRCLVLFSKRQFLTTCLWNGNLVCFLKLYFIYL